MDFPISVRKFTALKTSVFIFFINSDLYIMFANQNSINETRASFDARASMFNSFIARAMGILLALVLVTSVVEAQCPTDIWPTSGTYPWTGPHFTTKNVGGCLITVYYCSRLVPNGPGGTWTYQTYVYEIDDPNNCSGSADQLFADAEFVMNQDLAGSAPSCNSYVSDSSQSFSSRCWKWDTNGNLVGCTSGEYCVMTCHICETNGVVYSDDCVFTTQGTLTCSTTLPPSPWPRTNHTCYLYRCQ